MASFSTIYNNRLSQTVTDLQQDLLVLYQQIETLTSTARGTNISPVCPSNDSDTLSQKLSELSSRISKLELAVEQLQCLPDEIASVRMSQSTVQGIALKLKELQVTGPSAPIDYKTNHLPIECSTVNNAKKKTPKEFNQETAGQLNELGFMKPIEKKPEKKPEPFLSQLTSLDNLGLSEETLNILKGVET